MSIRSSYCFASIIIIIIIVLIRLRNAFLSYRATFTPEYFHH